MTPARLMEMEWKQDIAGLHPNAARWALQTLGFLREHPLHGKQLHDGAGRFARQGLVGCRRVKQRHGARNLRIVYRVLPSEQRAQRIEVIAIAHRSAVYELAAKRLKEKRGPA